MLKNLSKDVKIVRLKPDASGWTVAAGTSNVASDIIDMAGFDAVQFMVGFGAITSGAATSINVQQGAVSTLSDAADLAGTSITVADTDDNKVAVTEIIRPAERYLRLEILRATQNSAVDFALALLYGARNVPVTHDSATVITPEVHNTPAEGTV